MSRARRLRLGLLLSLLIGCAALEAAQELGYLAFLEPAPFTGSLTIGLEQAPLTVEQVDLLAPAARLVVAKVPRGAGYRLAARHLVAERAELGLLPERAAELGALVAINGDYHRLQGFCAGTVFSTFIEDGAPRVIGAPFDYACQWWLDAEGRPQAGRLELDAALELPDGARLPAFRNLDDPVGRVIVLDRCPAGAWEAPGYQALPVTVTAERRYAVSGPPRPPAWRPPAPRRSPVSPTPSCSTPPAAGTAWTRCSWPPWPAPRAASSPARSAPPAPRDSCS